MAHPSRGQLWVNPARSSAHAEPETQGAEAEASGAEEGAGGNPARPRAAPTAAASAAASATPAAPAAASAPSAGPPAPRSLHLPAPPPPISQGPHPLEPPLCPGATTPTPRVHVAGSPPAKATRHLSIPIPFHTVLGLLSWAGGIPAAHRHCTPRWYLAKLGLACVHMVSKYQNI